MPTHTCVFCAIVECKFFFIKLFSKTADKNVLIKQPYLNITICVKQPPLKNRSWGTN